MINGLAPHWKQQTTTSLSFSANYTTQKNSEKKSARKKNWCWHSRAHLWVSLSKFCAVCQQCVFFFFADFFRLGEGFHWKGKTARKLWKERPPLRKVNKGSLAPRGKCKSLWWKERLSAESNPWFFGFVSLRSVVGRQNSRHPCNQWDIKLIKANCELVTSVFPRFNAIGSMQYLSLFWLATVITLVLIRRYSIDKLSSNLTIVT